LAVPPDLAARVSLAMAGPTWPDPGECDRIQLASRLGNPG